MANPKEKSIEYLRRQLKQLSVELKDIRDDWLRASHEGNARRKTELVSQETSIFGEAVHIVDKYVALMKHQ